MMSANPVTVTPLQKHGGRHGGLIALAVLAASGLVVWQTQPDAPKPPPQPVVVQRAAASIPAPPPEASKPPAIVRAPRSNVTATGFITFDERRTAHVSAPVAGWLKKTRATSLGRKVRQGETLGVIYSPEVYLATVDLIAQVKTFRGQELLDAERYRLLRWGMPRADIERIERTLKPHGALRLVARVPGTVVAEQGPRAGLIDPSAPELFTITDPAFAWAFVEVPDEDAARLAVGSPAKLTIEGARPIRTKVSYVFRRAEQGMRTVRIDVYTPSRAFKPNTPVQAVLP